MEKIEKVESTGKLQLVDTRNLVIDNKDFFGEGLLDCYVTHPSIFGDSRGFFENSFDIGDEEFIDTIINDENAVDRLSDEQKKMQELFGFINKENTSNSAKGTIRGMHYQKEPRCQTKLVRVTNGKAIDVVVDIRKDSPTFGNWFGVLLTKENHRQLLVPKGFAHGFLALEDDTTFEYLVDEGYHKETEDGIPWDDEGVNIDWDTMFKQYGITNILTSDKDKLHSTLHEKVANDELTFTVASSRDTNRSRLMNSNAVLKSKIKQLEEKLSKTLEEKEILQAELNKQAIVNNYSNALSKEQLEKLKNSYINLVNKNHEMVIAAMNMEKTVAELQYGAYGHSALRYTNPDLNNKKDLGEC